MNTSTDAMTPDGDRPRAMRAAPHATHKFKLLLKREFWEHKGGFFWAPFIAGGVFLLLSLMGMITAEVFKSRAADHNIDINGAHVQVGALDLSKLTQHLSPEDLRVLHLSDIHFVPGQRKKADWLASLAALEPDLVVNTGDNVSHINAIDPVLEAPGRCSGSRASSCRAPTTTTRPASRTPRPTSPALPPPPRPPWPSTGPGCAPASACPAGWT